jgi:hypothetical protein
MRRLRPGRPDRALAMLSRMLAACSVPFVIDGIAAVRVAPSKGCDNLLIY